MLDFQSIISRQITTANPGVYGLVLLAGVVTSFTPCILPIVPIIVGFIGARNDPSRLRAFLLSVSYVCGLAVTFTVLGVVSALTGRLFGQVQSNPWSYIFIGNVVLIMAMWFMDIIYLPLPHFNEMAVQGKGIAPAFLLGLASGIVAAPCTAAVLGIILAYVATKHSVLFGGSLLFVYAIGLGSVLIIAGTSTGVVTALVGKGPLAEKVKKVFGITMFFLSQYFFIQAGKLF
jgi:thiol:disulfide interchange protein DsbD